MSVLFLGGPEFSFVVMFLWGCFHKIKLPLLKTYLFRKDFVGI